MSSLAFPAMIFNTSDYTHESCQNENHTELKTLRTLYVAAKDPAFLRVPILSIHIYKPDSSIQDPTNFATEVPQAILTLAGILHGRFTQSVSKKLAVAGWSVDAVKQIPVFGAVVVGSWIKFFRYSPETEGTEALGNTAGASMHLFWDAFAVLKTLETIKVDLERFFNKGVR